MAGVQSGGIKSEWDRTVVALQLNTNFMTFGQFDILVEEQFVS